ncbi:hypothetical protein [Nitrosomonas sp. Nm166]|uniref:hypothetical protein n=1 Tax=Nitrosomonas sp. Nm166 TaxID=1881054 RepID=UPI0008F31331|nr:hypothetical protein [Nitrosomonas sp. Nm166]SFF22795.1 hypothetical protein SAMN05428977_10766 [Nitrosomonas sp. Nm166]
MKTFHITSFVFVVGIGLGSASVIADTMSKDEYKIQKDKIDATYKVDKERCESLSGNAEDVCVAEAKGRRDVDKANLEAKNNPTDKNQYDARMARIDADYAIAKEKCDDLNGNAKDVCVEEAKAAKEQATNEAKAQLKP